MGIKLDYIGGQAPLDEIEISGLKIKTITTVGELNENVKNYTYFRGQIGRNIHLTD
jgi:hypothetical protein